ncbi:MAG: hypothetical protein EOO01_05735, partial [Chitinophagaceae bacterium]
MRKIKVGIVNYLNTLPLGYGIERSPVMNDIEYSGDYPSRLAKQLIDGTIDLGLVPVAVIPYLPSHFINTDYCIGTEDEVASVCLFSDVPIEEADTVLMDYQSRTSVALAKLLLRDHWKLTPEIVPTENDFRPLIQGRTAGLVIGDRALEQRSKSKYIYDLGSEWRRHTGLPFVFAAWVSREKLDPGFVAAFNDANAMGVAAIEEVLKNFEYKPYDLRTYFFKNMSY